MMTLFLAISSLLFPSASAQDERSPVELREVQSSGGFRLPPTRLEIRSAFRNGTVPGPVFEFGVQALRYGRFTLDGALSYSGQRSLGLQGPWRTVGAVDSNIDLMVELSNWLGIGPAVGVSTRIFRQQWTDMGAVVTPTVGVRTHMGLLRARRWSLGVSGRFSADLVQTRVAIENAEILTISPLEVQIGMRLQFGHGRDRRPLRGGES